MFDNILSTTGMIMPRDSPAMAEDISMQIAAMAIMPKWGFKKIFRNLIYSFIYLALVLKTQP